jgi:hypothetical protein
MKKSGKLACHVVNSNIAIGSLPTLQSLHGLLALFVSVILIGGPVVAYVAAGNLFDYNLVFSILCVAIKAFNYC